MFADLKVSWARIFAFDSFGKSLILEFFSIELTLVRSMNWRILGG